ncbi:MAG: RnfABCDGE type electron transport complex subunit D [Lachnospiraceae bacterium]|nr:RnfABCDGE type electron transport complex subunit D [Lachnospiraceae bacterium]
MEEKKLILSSSPHLTSQATTRGIMRDVIIALIPALIASVIYFGYDSIITVCACVASCVLFEWISRKVMKRKNTVGDLSAVVTGLLLAFNLPAGIPVYICIIGGVAAIVVCKQMFGGIGNNFTNPALTARIILLVSFASAMTRFPTPFAWIDSSIDAVTGATPLGLIAEGGGSVPSYMDLFLGNHGGSLGETCALALILGGIYLVARKVISAVIPLVYIGTVFLFSFALGQDPVVQILSGGLMLGAIFMATDYVTSPMTIKGKVIYALGCGFLTVCIRTFAALPEGVSYSIVLMNILTPLIDRGTMNRVFGTKKTGKGAEAK